MNKTILNVKIDPEIKQQAANLAKKMGLSLSGVVVSFLRHYIQTQELHVTAAPRMTPYLEKVMETAVRDYKAGKNIAGPFDTPEAVANYLDKLIKK